MPKVGPNEDDDGVSAYQRAHIDEAFSNKVVCLENSCQDQPEAIEEVCRTLMEGYITDPKTARGITKEKNQFSI